MQGECQQLPLRKITLLDKAIFRLTRLPGNDAPNCPFSNQTSALSLTHLEKNLEMKYS